jgi:hypothetical protein
MGQLHLVDRGCGAGTRADHWNQRAGPVYRRGHSSLLDAARGVQAGVALDRGPDDVRAVVDGPHDLSAGSRAGLRVGTSITEGTANFLVNRRMNKSQQMRWSRDGADLLLQVRCAVYNGTLGAGFGHRFDRIGKADPAFAKAA